MAKKLQLLALGLFLVGFTLLLAWLTRGHTLAVLEPTGIIATQQRDLLVFATVLSLVVIVPVYALTIFIVWKYRAENTKARYTPEWDHNRRLETIWWGIPCAIILVLSVVTWQSSHALDPHKSLTGGSKPVTIEVVALQWKWLFIYPEQNIATVNYVRFPADTPINFKVTADAPMNSFWIPQLGGQIYAMAGMTTQLHLKADELGTYAGSSANISGEGFAGMQFTAHATTQQNFYQWIQKTKRSGLSLDLRGYNALTAPSKNVPAVSFASVESGLYDTIHKKYMAPAGVDNDRTEQGTAGHTGANGNTHGTHTQ
ncbi:MAG TPA: ubiquinol oxidase subunit II [Candidatus Saccharimonadales bacterium]|nr:ubiquinol oxidase subunit II [Candidatus Saccharimonadales bacterium]